MRILLSFGFVAAVSATAGAQLGSSSWSLSSSDSSPTEVAPGLATPQPLTTVERHRRERRMPVAENPYTTLGADAASLGTGELGDVGPAPGLEGNPYARLGVARPYVAGNPYYVTSLDDPRDRVDDGRPVVFESNPYLY